MAFIGLGIAIWGAYKWYKNREIDVKSKIPIITTVFGLLIFIGGLGGSTGTDSEIAEEKTVESENTEVNDNELLETKNETDNTEETSEVSEKNAANEMGIVTSPIDFGEKANIVQEESDIHSSATSLGLVLATVSRIIDGDTVELSDGSRVRLIGVNTPESTTRTEEYGKEASNYTKSKLEGKQIYLQKDVSETDRYGRLLRLVWLQVPNDLMDENEIRTKMFNADLVLNGYAEPSTYPPDVTYSEYFRKFAREAREKEVGLWAYGPEGTTKGDLDSTTTTSNSNATSTNTNKPSDSSNANSTSNSTTKTYSGVEVIPGAPTSFKNCAEMNKYYPKGVPSDHPAYAPARDRDKDGWACER